MFEQNDEIIPELVRTPMQWVLSAKWYVYISSDGTQAVGKNKTWR